MCRLVSVGVFGIRIWYTDLIYGFGIRIWYTDLVHVFGKRVWYTYLASRLKRAAHCARGRVIHVVRRTRLREATGAHVRTRAVHANASERIGLARAVRIPHEWSVAVDEGVDDAPTVDL